MIPYFSYLPTYHRYRQEIDAAIARVISSGQLILGPEVAAFEREFAAYLGLPAAIAVSSGTDALILALLALGVGPGDEVLTVSNCGAPPISAIRATGATPRFVDVRPENLLLNPELLENAISPRTKCILPVHLYGRPVELEAILEIANRRGLHVIEDCAQAHGASYHGRLVGGFGAFGCFSFYPTKNLGAYGDGGMVVTSDHALAERVRMLRMYGFAKNGQHSLIEGRNCRLDELQAAVLRTHLEHLDEALRERRAIAERYRQGLQGTNLALPGEFPDGEHAFHIFAIRTDERSVLQKKLQNEGIGYGIHYPVPVHLMDAYRFLGYGAGSLPASENGCATVLSLPIYPGLSEAAQQQVLRALCAA